MQQPNILATGTLEEVLDDLACRFVVNVPDVELTAERICFQVEQAHWFYEDFVRMIQPRLPSFQLKTFSSRIFKHCHLLAKWAADHDGLYAQFMEYKFRIPVCGAIIMNENLDKCILVKGWKGNTWSFPRGKINQNEEYDHCAIREVQEETGYDITTLMSKTYIQRTMNNKLIRLYLVPGVPEDTKFQAMTRNEISDIRWFKLDELPGLNPNVKPGPFYMVVPFLNKLKQTIPTLRKELQRRKGGGDYNQQQPKRNSKVPSKEKTTSRQEKKKASSSSSSKQNVAEAQAATASSPPKESTMTLKSLLGVTDQSPTSSSVSSKSSGAEKLHKAVEPSKQPDALAQLFATSGVKSSTFAAATPKTAHRASLVEEMLKSRGGSTDRGVNEPSGPDSESEAKRKNSLLDTLTKGSISSTNNDSNNKNNSPSDLLSTLQQASYNKQQQQQQPGAPSIENHQKPVPVPEQQQHPLLHLLKSAQKPDSSSNGAEEPKEAKTGAPDGLSNATESVHPLIQLLRKAEEPQQPAKSNSLLDILKGQ